MDHTGGSSPSNSTAGTAIPTTISTEQIPEHTKVKQEQPQENRIRQAGEHAGPGRGSAHTSAADICAAAAVADASE